MNRLNSLVLCACLIVSAACQQGEKTIVVPGDKSGMKGTVDGGGANGLKGRPLESYRVRMSEHENVVTELFPIVEVIVTKIPQLAGDLIHILLERAWYFVPVRLDTIPSVTLGAYFPTDQIAIQNPKEVWIDSELFAEMSEKDRLKLLMHEMVIGVRLLEFSGKLDLCLADLSYLRFFTESDPEQKAKYDQGRQKCFDDAKKDFNAGNPWPGVSGNINLTKEDYMNIRELTHRLLTSYNDFNSEELKAWLTMAKFRRYERAQVY